MFSCCTAVFANNSVVNVILYCMFSLLKSKIFNAVLITDGTLLVGGGAQYLTKIQSACSCTDLSFYSFTKCDSQWCAHLEQDVDVASRCR